DGKVRVLGQKEIEELFERHHLRHRNQLALDPEKVGMRVAHHRDQLLYMNQADRIIEMTAAEREPGVTRLQGFLDVLLEGLLDIEENNFSARGHDVAHHSTAQIEGIEEQIAAEGRDFVRLFALIEDKPQLLLTMGQF